MSKRVQLTDEELELFAAGKYCEQPEPEFMKLKAATERVLSSLTDREREVLAARMKGETR